LDSYKEKVCGGEELNKDQKVSLTYVKVRQSCMCPSFNDLVWSVICFMIFHYWWWESFFVPN